MEVYGRLDTWVHVSATAVFATSDNKTPEEFKRVVLPKNFDELLLL